MRPKDAQHRLKVLKFWKKYRTLYHWQAKLKAAGGDPIALQPKKSIPKRKRQSHWPKEIIEQCYRITVWD